MELSCVNWIRLNIQYSMLLHEDTNNLFIYLLHYLSRHSITIYIYIYIYITLYSSLSRQGVKTHLKSTLTYIFHF